MKSEVAQFVQIKYCLAFTHVCIYFIYICRHNEEDEDKRKITNNTNNFIPFNVIQTSQRYSIWIDEWWCLIVHFSYFIVLLFRSHSQKLFATCKGSPCMHRYCRKQFFNFLFGFLGSWVCLLFILILVLDSFPFVWFISLFCYLVIHTSDVPK